MTDDPAALPSPSPSPALSPSLDASNPGSYELKFLLDDVVADEILILARQRMRPDPHADPLLHDRYHINSLYFDTEQLDVFRQAPGFRRRKYRLRRYGRDAKVYLERKAKSKGIVKKRRSSVTEEELARLLHAHHDPEWIGHWFHQRLTTRSLRPTCQVAYERTARVDTLPEGLIRLTVDRQIRCRSANGVALPVLADGQLLLAGQSVLELKFRAAMPTFFKNLIADFSLNPASVSKYRRSIVACGLHLGVCEATVPTESQRRSA